MKVLDIKLLNDGVNVTWLTADPDGGTTKHSRNNGPAAAPSLVNAVDELKDDLATIMEEPKSWMETVTVKGAKFKYDDDGAVEARISFTKRFKNGRAVGYSAPPVRQKTDHKQNGTSWMSEDLERRMLTVLRETERYIGGLREQTEHA